MITEIGCKNRYRLTNHNQATSKVFSCSLYIGWSDVTVIYGHDTISMLWGMMSYWAKITGEILSRYLNKIESVGMRKA